MIAFLVLAHQSDIKYYEYWNDIAKNEHYHVIVHIDKGSHVDILALNSHFKFLVFVSSEYVYWADRSMIDATISILRKAIDFPEVRNIFLLSADSILLQDDKSVIAFCESHGTYIIGAQNNIYQKRSHKYYFFKGNRYSKGFIARALDRVALSFQIWDRYTPFCGSLKGPQWLMLSRFDAEAALKIYENSAHYLDYTNCADEFFFQNTITESSLRCPDRQKLIYTKWKNKNSPDFLSSKDIKSAFRKGYLLARKVKR